MEVDIHNFWYKVRWTFILKLLQLQELLVQHSLKTNQKERKNIVNIYCKFVMTTLKTSSILQVCDDHIALKTFKMWQRNFKDMKWREMVVKWPGGRVMLTNGSYRPANGPHRNQASTKEDPFWLNWLDQRKDHWNENGLKIICVHF